MDISEMIWEPEKYDSLRRMLIPSFDLLYKTVVDLLKMSDLNGEVDILDIGAGTGLLSEYINKSLPKANITLLDRSEGMLKKARQRFKGKGNINYFVKDLSDDFTEKNSMPLFQH